MLDEKQLVIINRYVDEQYYDREKLIKYLEIHDTVGNEIFDYVDLKNRKLNRKEAHSIWLDDYDGYLPVSTDVFIRRIPFYFYTWNGNHELHCGDIGNVLSSKWREIKLGKLSLETLYKAMEYMFYEKKIEPYYIFNYLIEQTDLVTEQYFLEWVDYLHICDQLGIEDIMPKNFITTYNRTLEKIGRKPIIFVPNWDMHMEKPYIRYGTILEFEGVFPVDEDGNPILRWIGLKLLNIEKVEKIGDCKAKSSILRLQIKPESVIYYQDNDGNGNPFWNQVYAGPLTMSIDNSILRERRELLNYTQEEVANAIGANVRTYQKWESGETQPAGFYLLRLMNWLDITNVQDIINYNV